MVRYTPENVFLTSVMVFGNENKQSSILKQVLTELYHANVRKDPSNNMASWFTKLCDSKKQVRESFVKMDVTNLEVLLWKMHTHLCC